MEFAKVLSPINHSTTLYKDAVHNSCSKFFYLNFQSCCVWIFYTKFNLGSSIPGVPIVYRYIYTNRIIIDYNNTITLRKHLNIEIGVLCICIYAYPMCRYFKVCTQDTKRYWSAAALCYYTHYNVYQKAKALNQFYSHELYDYEVRIRLFEIFFLTHDISYLVSLIDFIFCKLIKGTQILDILNS